MNSDILAMVCDPITYDLLEVETAFNSHGRKQESYR